MHGEGERARRANPDADMPATDDEIREKYLERAIREINALTRDLQACRSCPRGSLMPVLGSGHPQADVFLLKHAPAPSEVEEGVAFYGRAGTALTKALKRLQIDPLAVYGTCAVKCPVADPSLADPGCAARVLDELAIVQPRIVVVMGEDARAALDDLGVPLARALEPVQGVVQRWTPSCEALVVPDIDRSLDEEDAKRAFWAAFRVLGDWWAQQPPW
jgi:uracil-DNA glycosylase